mmetsp:Transcript_27543/g.88963  ORF Transcript_27543/g.88963 Transcript_27543/m.88963 type:complete len:229 (+) Transcript_27543:1500-2186(+)
MRMPGHPLAAHSAVTALACARIHISASRKPAAAAVPRPSSSPGVVARRGGASRHTRSRPRRLEHRSPKCVHRLGLAPHEKLGFSQLVLQLAGHCRCGGRHALLEHLGPSRDSHLSTSQRALHHRAPVSHPPLPFSMQFFRGLPVARPISVDRAVTRNLLAALARILASPHTKTVRGRRRNKPWLVIVASEQIRLWRQHGRDVELALVPVRLARFGRDDGDEPARPHAQ